MRRGREAIDELLAAEIGRAATRIRIRSTEACSTRFSPAITIGATRPHSDGGRFSVRTTVGTNALATRRSRSTSGVITASRLSRVARSGRVRGSSTPRARERAIPQRVGREASAPGVTGSAWCAANLRLIRPPTGYSGRRFPTGADRATWTSRRNHERDRARLRLAQIGGRVFGGAAAGGEAGHAPAGQ